MPSIKLVPVRLPVPPILSFVLLIAMVVGSFAITVRLNENTVRLTGISDYRRKVSDVLNAARDAETGQRGFLLTGDEKYLAPYRASTGVIGSETAALSRMEGQRGRGVARELGDLSRGKIAELSETIALERAGQRAAAVAIVRTDRGKRLMDSMRGIVGREIAWATAQIEAGRAETRLLLNLLVIGLFIGAVTIVVLSLLWARDTRQTYDTTKRARETAEAALAALQSEVVSRERAELQLRQIQKMESLGQLTGGIAHDFNNMLAIVIGGIELAKRRLRSDPDRADEMLDNAREGATRAATLTARLLAFSRNQPLAPAPLDVNKLLGGMCDMLGRTLGEQISVECVYAAGMWRCYADPNEVENAILNLAINARDAIPGTGKLTIETANAYIDDNYARAWPEVEAGQYVLICVTDTGVGMPKDVLDRAFDPFFTTKTVGKGTGLGLSQVFGFVKQSGGHVAIYSEVGQGTSVKLYLPRFAGSDVGQTVATAPDMVPEGEASEIILVVEDEQRVRHFAVDALRELGYTAISSASPGEALKLLGEQPEITMLFTDIVMPDMTGRQLADLALQMRPDLKVLFTTGYTRNAVVHNGMIDIGVAFLAKPYGIGEMARKIREVLDGGGVNRSV